MTKEEIWQKFCNLNPDFRGFEKVQLSPAKIQKMIETTYKYAFDAGFERGKVITNALNKAANQDNVENSAFNDIFGGMFGGDKNK